MTILFDWFETPGTNAEEKRTLHARPCFNGTSNTKTIAKRIQAPPVLAVSRRAYGFDHREAQNGIYYTRRYYEL